MAKRIPSYTGSCDSCSRNNCIWSTCDEDCQFCEHRCCECKAKCSCCHLACDNRRDAYYNESRYV